MLPAVSTIVFHETEAMRIAAAPPRRADGKFPDRRSLVKGLRLFGVHYALYGATLLGALAPLPLWLNVLAALVNGVLIALLFIVGHDGAHGSLVPGRTLNLWLARAAFVPCVHAVSLWRVIHNKLHHGRTNLKGVDGVWAPMNKRDYDAASPARRWLERVYRGPAGPLIYYYLTFWPYRVLLPLAPETRRLWRLHLFDVGFAFAGWLATLAAIVTVGSAWTPERSPLTVFVVAWVVPYAVWNYLMAFTTYLNHTHPLIAWFDDEAAWKRHQGNALDSTHVLMPVNAVPLYTKVMAHTAHHVQTDIPVYALKEAQGELRALYGQLHEYTLTLGAYRTVYRTCKLYDFTRMCWTDFDGVPTS